MKSYQFKAYILRLVNGEFCESQLPEKPLGKTTHHFRQCLELSACRNFGEEGRDRRMVQDTSIIGFYARNLHTGDCISIK
jgi:hypothetical protein